MSIFAQNDLTKGNLLHNLIRFAIPFLLANLLQALYGAVDLWVVGKFGGGKIGVAAVSNGSETMHLVMSFIMGLTTGSTVLIGGFFGAKDSRNTSRSIGTSLLFALFAGVFASVVMACFSPLLARLIRTPGEALSETVDYLVYCSLGVFFIFGYNALSAIFRALGNSAAPLIFVAVSCVLNVFGDLLLVAKYDMGPKGAAIATTISQGVSMLLALIYLKAGDFGFRFCRENFRMPWELLSKYLRIGFPVAVQGILINVSFLFIVSIANSIDGNNAATGAGYGIVNRLNGFAMLPAASFAMAMAALTAQNLGANRPVRALKTLWLALGITMSLGVIFLLTLQLFPETMVALFIDRAGNGAEEVIYHGALYARSFSWDYVMVPIVFCTNGFFNGCGRTLFSMTNNLVCTFLVRLPASWFFSTLAGATLYHVGFAAPLASICSNIVALIYLFSGRWYDGKLRFFRFRSAPAAGPDAPDYERDGNGCSGK